MTGNSDTLASVMSGTGEVPSAAVGFLLRGADDNWLLSANRFLASYKAHAAGFPHTPHVMLKGFIDPIGLIEIERIFRNEGFMVHHLDDDGFDIAAYARWARNLDSEYICAFNSHSEILVDN
jgi:hypothetical protein